MRGRGAGECGSATRAQGVGRERRSGAYNRESCGDTLRRATLRPRVVAAVAQHEIRALVVNPSVAATAVMVLGLAVMFMYLLGFAPSYAGPFLGQAAVTSVTAIGTVGMLVEMREHGGIATLVRAGVMPRELAVGTVLGGVVVAEAVAVACALVIEGSVVRALVAAASLLASAIPSACLMVALGLCASGQEQASPGGSSLVIWGMLMGVAPTVVGSPWFLPFGAASELMDILLYGAASAVPPAFTVLAALAYAGLSAVVLRRVLVAH